MYDYINYHKIHQSLLSKNNKYVFIEKDCILSNNHMSYHVIIPVYSKHVRDNASVGWDIEPQSPSPSPWVAARRLFGQPHKMSSEEAKVLLDADFTKHSGETAPFLSWQHENLIATILEQTGRMLLHNWLFWAFMLTEVLEVCKSFRPKEKKWNSKVNSSVLLEVKKNP